MEFTGERVVLDYTAIAQGIMARQANQGVTEAQTQLSMERLIGNHVARYYFAEQLLASRQAPSILDVACGSGYGTYILAGRSGTVERTAVGVDIDAATVEYAAAQFSRPGLQFMQCDCRELPWSEPAFDVIVSFETLEHLDADDGARFVQHLAALLRPGGLLVISTPAPDSEAQDEPNNTYHRHEYQRGEFEALLARHFDHFVLFEQGFASGCVILPLASSSIVPADADARTRIDRQMPLTPAPLAYVPAPGIGTPPASRIHIALCAHDKLPDSVAPLLLSFRSVRTPWQP